MRAPARRVAAIAVAALTACASPPPAAPPLAPAQAPSASPAPAVSSAPADPAPFVPRPPFSVIARAPGSDFIGVLPLEDGAAILVARRASAGAANVAVLDHDEVTLVPQLAAGFPEKLASEGDLPLVAGRWPEDVWRARGAPCQVEQWQSNAWAPRAPDAPPSGACTHLAAWTSGAAIAVVDGTERPVLRAFGRHPRAVPAPPLRFPGQNKDCGALFGMVHALFAWPTGEVVAVGATCASPRTWIARWPSGSPRAVTLEAQIDPDGPYLVRALSRDDLQIDGGGILPGDRSTEVSVRARFHAAAGALRRTSIEAHELNLLERWMVNGKAILGLPAEDPSDGFVYEGYRLTSSDDVFVTGSIVRGGKLVERLVLRSRAVKKPFVFP